MKKIFISLLICVVSILSIIMIIYHAESSIGQIKSQYQTEIQVEPINIFQNKQQFYDTIKNACNKNNINAYRVAYPYTKEGEKGKVILYANIVDTKTFYKNITIKSGEYLTSDKEEQNFLSTEKTNDPNQIGQISFFKGDTIVEIRQIDTNPYDDIEKGIILDTDNKELATNFIDMQNCTSSLTDKTDYYIYANTDQLSMQLSSILFIIMLALILAICLTYLYLTILKYKEFAIMKLFGYSAKKIYYIQSKNTLRYYALSMIISLIIILFYLKLYNNFANLLSFIMMWIIGQLILCAIIFIIVGLLNLIIYKIKGHDVLKNKKPLNIMTYLLRISKIIFGIMFVLISVNVLASAIQIKHQSESMRMWEFGKDYSLLRMLSSNDPNNQSSQNEWSLKCKEYYNSVNQKGAFILKPGGGLIQKFIRDLYISQGRNLWDKEVNDIAINANYLKLNKIYDLNNNVINLSDINDVNETILLVPEKYMEHETEIKESYVNQIRYYTEDDYLKAHGKAIPNRILPQVRIYYVKDNQKYFTFNPEYGKEENNTYTDPIARIVTNNNVDASEYLSILTNGNCYINIKDPNNPMPSMYEDLNKCGLLQYVVSTPTIYSLVADQLNILKQKLFIYTMLFVISIVVFSVLSTIHALNYLELDKLKIAVKKLNGYSKIKRNQNIYLVISISWIITFLFSFLFSSIFTIVYISLTLFLIDCIITQITLELKELKNTRDILKGE